MIEKLLGILYRLRPILVELAPLAKLILSVTRDLMQKCEEDQKKRRLPKSGTIAIMRQVHKLRKDGLKWDVVHKRMKNYPGYKIKSAATLRQRFRRVMKNPDWAQMVTN